MFSNRLKVQEKSLTHLSSLIGQTTTTFGNVPPPSLAPPSPGRDTNPSRYVFFFEFVCFLNFFKCCVTCNRCRQVRIEGLLHKSQTTMVFLHDNHVRYAKKDFINGLLWSIWSIIRLVPNSKWLPGYDCSNDTGFLCFFFGFRLVTHVSQRVQIRQVARVSVFARVFRLCTMNANEKSQQPTPTLKRSRGYVRASTVHSFW